MTLTINQTYKIVVRIFDKTLTYVGEVLEIEEKFITFKDKYGQTLSYNIHFIVSYEKM